MTGRLRWRDDDGNAIVEFVFVAVIVMIPLVYLIVTVAAVQRSRVAVSDAAREAGRAFATSDTAATAMARARVAARIALADQGARETDVALTFVAGDTPCNGATVEPVLAPNAVYTVCVTRHVALPAVPRFLAGRGITTVGRYVLHVDEYRTVP